MIKKNILFTKPFIILLSQQDFTFSHVPLTAPPQTSAPYRAAFWVIKMTRATFLPRSSSLAFSADLILLAVAHDSEGWCNRGKWKRGYYLNLTATQRDSSLPLWHSTLTSAGGTQQEARDKAWLIYRQPFNCT